MEDNLEQLLKLAGAADEVALHDKTEDAGVLNFILANNIVVGTNKIPQSTIYKLYASNTIAPLSTKHFFKEFRKYFKQGRTNSTRFFLLNSEPFPLQEDFSIYKLSHGFQKKLKKTKKVANDIQESQ